MVATIVFALATTSTGAAAAASSAPDPNGPTSRPLAEVEATRQIPSTTLTTGRVALSEAMPAAQPEEATWPDAQTLTLEEGRRDVSDETIQLRVPEATPELTATGDVDIRLLDRDQAQKAGIEGLLFTVSGAGTDEPTGPLELSVDYSDFAGAYGADWASRLHLVSLPACVLETPERAECQVQTPLGSTNDVEDSTVTGSLVLDGETTDQVAPDAAPTPGVTPTPAASAPSDPPPGPTGSPTPTPRATTAPTPTPAPSPTPTPTDANQGDPTPTSTPAPTSSAAVPTPAQSPQPAATTATSTTDASARATDRGGLSVAAASFTADRRTRVATIPTAARRTAATSTAGVVALTAAASGSSGNWGATPLNASATWQVSAQTGDFTWSYPLPVPPATGGPEPDLELSYSSGSLDGKIAGENTQSSWIGDGWDLSPGFIERKYVPCSQDMGGPGALNTRATGDLCWGGYNATLAFGGHGGELVKDEATGVWRLKDDDGTRVQLLTGAVNGDNNGEYWKVTTTDGTQYFFGRGVRSATDPLELNSTWLVPVYGNNTGEPCYRDQFASSICMQAWRWNLEYVIDPSENSMTYVYAKETNSYERNLGSGVSVYNPGGYLTRIDYGQRAGAETSEPPQRVEFAVAERCLPNGAITCTPGELAAATAPSWPDVPFDRICTSTTVCPQFNPSFFTRKRLVAVTTKVLTGSTYQDVDAWTLEHTFPSPGDGTSPALWLASIQRQGRDGTAITVPKVDFTGTQMPNRVDALGDGAPPMYRYRITSIATDTGGTVSVGYTGADCSPTSLPASPDTNTQRCFPAMWTPEGSYTAPRLEYFHKYLVTSAVTNAGPTDSSIPIETRYSYVGTPGWHYDDNPLVPATERTWGEYRGYDTVEVITGATNTAQTRTRHRFFRGMNGDRLASGTRAVTIDGIPDDDQLNGLQREQITYNGTAEVSGVLSTPWSGVSATAADGTHAYFIDTATTIARTTAPARPGGVLTTRTDTTFDPTYGVPTMVDDQGDTTLTTDDRCTRIDYVRNTGANLVRSVARTETVAVACGTTPARPGDVLQDTRTLYDGLAYGAAPTRALVTGTQSLSGYTGATPTYLTRATSAYDAQGRQTATADALGRTTRTAYTPATGGPLTRTVVTSPDPDGTGPVSALVTTTDVDPERGTPTRQTDPTGRVTSATQDALGRTTKVWMPGRNQSSETPTASYEYTNAGGVNAVLTKTLNAWGAYQTSTTLYDGLLRPRQTQTPSAVRDDPSRIITDTLYDSRGLAVQTNQGWYTDGNPGTAIVVPDRAVPARTRTVYDGAGRPSVQIFDALEAERFRTTTTYGGDRVSVDPPTGAVPTTTLVDARNRTTELRQYLGAAPTGTYQATTYRYDNADRLAATTDPAGNTWTYAYDTLGRQTSSSDPDKGPSSVTYDDADQVLTTTDARGAVLAYAYDGLGRKTAVRDTSPTGTLRASFTYDTVTLGQLTSATRYEAGAAYTSAVTGYDSQYRPRGQTVTVPSVEGALAGSYTTTFAYTPDGQLASTTLPAAGNLKAETVSTNYDAANKPEWLSSGPGWGVYVAASTYSPYGEPMLYDLGNTVSAQLGFVYEDGTRRLARTWLIREGIDGFNRNTYYAYDDAGNPTSVIDKPTVAGASVDAQCFTYDGLRRLTQAWTPADANCATAPTVAALGGPAPSWTSYTYDTAGNRTTDVTHKPAGNTTRTYTLPAPGQARPHAITAATTTAPTGTTTATYAYDAAGNTTTRPAPNGAAQTLTWDTESRLASVATAGATPDTYLYDATGARLIRRQGGARTLYLPGGQELTATATGTVRATRYYTFNGQTIAVRTGPKGSDVTTLVPDPQGTSEIAITNVTNTLTQRRDDPFGNPRGTTPTTWPTDRGFLNKPTDTTGLTQIGARYYDPTIGRFISVDPVMDLTDPQQWAAYTYANNNPITYSDPTGLRPMEREGESKKRPGLGSRAVSFTKGLVASIPLMAKGMVKTAFDQNIYTRTKFTIEATKSVYNDARGTRSWSDYTEVVEMRWNRDYVTPAKTWWNSGDDNQRAYRSGVILGTVALSVAGPKAVPKAFGGRSASAAAAPTECFVAGTPVLLANGSSKAIEDVQTGDKVASYNTESGERETRTVARTFVHENVPTYDVKVDGATITTTEDHPLFLVGKGWTAASDLQRGDQLREPDGSTVAVDSVRATGNTATVYNFEVESTHDYYVQVGTHWVLVHNDCWFVYRALNSADRASIDAGLGITAKNPEGSWSLGEHVTSGSSRSSWANDPWISTSRDPAIAAAFDSGHGVVRINMSLVDSTFAEAWQIYPRTNGVEGLPYHYSIWQQEVSIFGSIPRRAIS